MEKNIAQNIFDSIVHSYDKFLNSTTFGQIKKWQKELIENSKIGKYAVDIGTGTGEVIKYISEKFPYAKPIGLDISFQMLKKAKEKGIKATFIKANALNMPFKDNSIDNIFCSLSFRHFPTDLAIKEFKRVLKTGGEISILDISKPKSKIFYNAVYFFADKIFRPIGRLIFSKEEYDYFVESVENSKTVPELVKIFEENQFKIKYTKERFFKLIHIIVVEKI
ncbi:class I SAM-dependent methyltransferase [Venenivibrio stagnispumantis]|uniref:Demethylmenaquinone methyltransferase / 2-methoxy-6-polyprenyl-1,4-benzoquinol methylase n=1 Tax=Venenivibrio stagnispumantis TaxID=407998 RepID=A0AA45WIC4_9AQUI|nr:class I SAM-dependent methyltransferase [Venenivibrio stagnispumantis]MCW4572780.1 class I SAM-dependent methyltransferase [Venenivibrio stagnispumantis]SMP00345.1 demethylmenaquinone methyltransferase / 2-methoxy-6-polyprenyl-1,4-benzoquinol methylase [Venenivibrio stagnispumantis]